MMLNIAFKAKMELTQKQDSLEVVVEDCTCELVWPVAESKCSCPSRSICKHIVMAVLYAKNIFDSESISAIPIIPIPKTPVTVFPLTSR